MTVIVINGDAGITGVPKATEPTSSSGIPAGVENYNFACMNEKNNVTFTSGTAYQNTSDSVWFISSRLGESTSYYYAFSIDGSTYQNIHTSDGGSPNFNWFPITPGLYFKIVSNLTNYAALQDT